MYIIVTLLATAIIFGLRYEASLCNAKMDTVTSHFAQSIYKDKDPQWFDPKVSWTNKDDYGNIAGWRLLAQKYLPVYAIVNLIKPAYDPFSDFWHWEKTKMIMLDSINILVAASTTFFLTRIDNSFIIALPIIAMYMSWTLGWNGTFDSNLKKLRA